ncbi:MAG: hypothetical protein E7291_00095 [Lachnospiraceae bacterium]|nr:hypothetical protein [Lachnospiraceae bacterium]
MYKRIRSRIVLLLLLTVYSLSGCSTEDFLSEVPLTMQAVLEETSPKDERSKDGGFAIEADETLSEMTGLEAGKTESQSQSETVSVSGEDRESLPEEGFGYCYNSLSAEEQIWYEDILQALGGMVDQITLSEQALQAGLDESCIDKIFQCVLNDHPEIFYVDGYTYTQYSRGEQIVSIVFEGNYLLSPEEVSVRRQEIDCALQPILAGIDTMASDYDKVKYVYETIILNTEYDLNAPDNQNIYSVFVGGSSVCQGYAKATQYLLNCLGVECVLVQGRVDSGEGHAWNLVHVDGSYYYIDTTWGDPSYLLDDGVDSEGLFLPEINYDYFCVTTEQLLCTHILENVVSLPECVDTAANYYVRQGALFDSYDKEQMSSLFARAFEENRGDVTVKCVDEECYLQIKEALIDNQEIFEYLSEDEISVSYTNNDKQLSLTFWVTN